MSNAFTQYSQAVGKGLVQGTTTTWRQSNSLIGFVSILATPLPLRPAYLIGQIASNAVVHGTNEVKAVRESRQAAIAAQAATPPAVAATAAAAGQPAPAPRAIYVVPPTKSA